MKKDLSMLLMWISAHGIWVEIGIWLLIACVFWAIYHGIYKYLNYKYLSKRMARPKKSWPRVLLKSIHKPLLIYLWFIFICWLLQKVERIYFGKTIFHYWPIIYKLATVTALFSVILLFIRHMEKLLLSRLASAGKTATNKTAIAAMAQIARLVTIIFWILMVLQVTGIPISALLTIGGISTLAIGFAAKDTLENYMGGAMIYMDRPFGVDDWISLPSSNIEGIVERIGWRLTKMRALDKKLIYIPNKLFSNGILINGTQMTNRRIHKVISVRYQDAAVVEPIVQDIREMLANNDDIDQQAGFYINLDTLNDSSLDLLLNAFTKTTNNGEFRAIQQTVLLKSMDIVHAHGADCAFPTRTIDLPDAVVVQTQSSLAGKN